MFKKKIYKPGQGNRGSGNVGGANAIVEKGKDVKKKESPLPFPGRGLGSSSPISESGEAQVITERDRGAQAIVEIGEKDRDTKKPEFRLPVPGRGQASSSPISEDGNDKELLNSICQLHRQIRADHTPAKDIVSAIDELKREIQNLICELADPASGTHNSNDLYTVATLTRNNNRKLNSDLVKTRKEMKEISELAVAVGQEVGFQPDRRNTDKDRLSLNAKEALADIKRMNRALSEELNKLSKNIESYSTDKTEQQPKQRCDKNQQPSHPRKQPQTTNQTKQKDHKSSQVNTNLEIVSKAVSTFDDLWLYKREMKEISELAVAVGQEVGFQPDRRNTDKDSLSLNAKEALADIKRMNRALSEELNKLSKNIEGYLTNQTEQQRNDKKPQPNRPHEKPETSKQPNKKKEQSEEKKDHKSSQFDTNLEIISKAVSNFDDLQQYKGLSKLADNKMTECNPNIANFGDPNRSTKIAEVYSAIYDNEWTDALIFCHTKLRKEYSEDEALQALSKTLIICYKICQEKSDEWMEKTKGVLQRCSRELMVDIQSEEILMQIIEGQKVVSDKVSEHLLKEIRPKKDLVATKYAKNKEMSSQLYKMIIQNKFFEKCFTLCWKMIVQNPRMILVEGPSRGNTYDSTIFREYKSSGSKVVFTIWPALYLHEDGPLLVKGVVKVE